MQKKLIKQIDLVNDRFTLCSICLEYLLDSDFFDQAGICFGPLHEDISKIQGNQDIVLRSQAAQADEMELTTSRNLVVEEAYRKQIKSQQLKTDHGKFKTIPADATFCPPCIKKIIGGRPPQEIPKIEEHSLRMNIEDRLESKGELKIATIGGVQGDKLNLLQIPARKSKPGVLSRKLILRKTKLLVGLRNYLFPSDEEIQCSMKIDQKLDPEHWKKVSTESYTMDLQNQENLVKCLLRRGFTQRQIEHIAEVHNKITTRKLYMARKMINQVKKKTLESLQHEIEYGIETVCLKNKGDKIKRKIQWWRIKNSAKVVENWINRDIDKICFHTSQNPKNIQLVLNGDHFGNTYGLYISRPNTLEPNAPSNFLPLASISNSNDTGEIIYDIIKPVIEDLSSFEKINLAFPKAVGLQRSPPDSLKHEWNNLPVHNFASSTKFRGPENLLCYQLGEIKEPSTEKDLKKCEICHRRFENNQTLNLHISIDHEIKGERE